MRVPPFQMFLDEHREAVYRFLNGFVAPGDVDDCFQETFLSALRAYPELRNGTNLRSWVLTIAYRKAMDSHRGRARRAVPVANLPEQPSRGSLADDHALWDVVRALPDKQRAAVVQRYANGLPYRDIAAILECTEEAARQNVREGLKKLKEMVR
ncbi:MAG: RNA polymerase sigma factor [Actinomycetota bacterium]